MAATKTEPWRTNLSRNYELIAPRRGHILNRDLAEPGPGKLLMRVRASGLCASELMTWATGQPRYPLTLGHEPVGRVVAVGAGVELAPGTWIGGRIAPSFCDHVLADLADVVVIPDGLDPMTTIPEPLGCVTEGHRRTPVPMGARVAVVGLGFMGLVMVQLLRNTGDARLTAIDPRQDARDAALANGADEAYDPGELPRAAFSWEESDPSHGFDVVVEASGAQAGLDLATNLVRPHGALSILGFHQGRRAVDLHAWNWKAIDVINAHVRDRALLRSSTSVALRLQAAGRLDITRLLTHRFPLDRADEAFATLQSKPHGYIKAVIDLEE